MFPLRHLAVFLLLTGFAASSTATGPTLVPASPTDQDAITLTTRVSSGGKNLCDLHLPVETTLTWSGNDLHIAYHVKERGPDSPPPPNLCLGTTVPVPVVVELDALPAGNYRARFVGLTLGQPNATQSVAFQVSGAGFGDDLPPPTVTPQPATPDDELTLTAQVSSGGVLGCDLHTPFETSLTRTGSTFQLDYAIRMRGPDSPFPPCVLVPIPIRLTASLGTLPPGTYEVKVIGTTLGQANAPQSVTFTVADDGSFGTPTPAPQYVPASGLRSLMALACALMLLAAWRMRRF